MPGVPDKDKMLLTNQRKFHFTGYYDIDEVDSALKSYLEDEKHYDTEEIDLERRNTGGKQKLISKVIGDRLINDYYGAHVRYVLLSSGNEVEKEIDGVKKKLTKGTLSISVNSYLVSDHRKERSHYGTIGKFIMKVYDYFFIEKEKRRCLVMVLMDTGGLLNVFRAQRYERLK